MNELIFLPMLAHIALVVFLYVRLGQVKDAAFKRDDVDHARRNLHEDAWPDDVLQVNNNLANQFALPTIFYALTFLFWALGWVNWVTLGLSIIFVLSRVWHTYIHLGSNHVPSRRKAFTIGVVAIILMLLTATYAILT